MLLTEEEKEIMTEENYSLIYFIAHKFSNTGYDIDELASVATVGFVKALNTFDREREIKFTTYSVHCMRNEILFFLRKERKHSDNNISLHYVLSKDSTGKEFNMEQLLSDEMAGQTSVLDEIEMQGDSEMLYSALGHLTENEKYIAVYRFGLNQGIQKTQQEIAEAIGMSQANVSKIEKGLLVKLRVILERRYNMFWSEESQELEEMKKEELSWQER